MVGGNGRKLRMTFHGRIIDHFGMEMYQSPVAAIAELIANAWDADSERVDIELPERNDSAATITISDHGDGMTFRQCEERYLNIGWCRRPAATGPVIKAESERLKRPILGRKGIGKFAGFGIADVIRVETVSRENGERTVFEMDIRKLRSDTYMVQGGEVDVVQYEPPNETRRRNPGTTITLKSLTLNRRIPPCQFARSMARRFMLHQYVADFIVTVNGERLPQGEDIEKVELVFPRDYEKDEIPTGLELDPDREWGMETLKNDHPILWRFVFYKEPIDEEELRGVAVFSHIKVAQTPFLFQLTGGLSGQHGTAYLSGKVEADFVGDLSKDVTAPERQRINWDHPETKPLLDWGQIRVQELLKIWQKRRANERVRKIENRMAGFSDRLQRLRPHERRTVTTALRKVAQISSLSDSEFDGLGIAILNSWERGRLMELIEAISSTDLTAERLLSLLIEAEVMNALSIAEVVRNKIGAIKTLREMANRGENENQLRDYIAERPYILDPKWETFKKETTLRHILDGASEKAGYSRLPASIAGKRLDLALASAQHLLIVEFMKPEKPLDIDHLNRCHTYHASIRAQVSSQTALAYSTISGLVVADKVDKDSTVRELIESLKLSDIMVYEWETLLEQAEKKWKDFLELVIDRSPKDDRVEALRLTSEKGDEKNA